MKKLSQSLQVLLMNIAVGFVDFIGKLQKKLLPPPFVLLKYAIENVVINRSIYVAAELGIADLLKDGPKSVEQLAKETDTNADTLYRIMRTLTGAGIFKAKKNRLFETNNLGKHLQTDREDSMVSFIKVAGAEWVYDIWGGLLKTTKTGKDFYENKYGRNFFDWLRDNSEVQKVFDEGMTSVSALSDIPVSKAYDFSAFKTVVDVGGGYGSQMITILNAFPDLKAFIFDLPLTIKIINEDNIFKQSDLDGKPGCIAGDFFESIPAGYDAYFMKSILHDWEDEKAVKILTNCRKAMRTDSTLLIVEHILKDDDNAPDYSKVLDINILALMGGRVRTKTEYGQIFEASGLKLTRVISTASPFSMIEAKPI